MNNIVEGVRILCYGAGGIFFFAAFMYVMMRLLVAFFRDKD